jgi:hypothetical protein
MEYRIKFSESCDRTSTLAVRTLPWSFPSRSIRAKTFLLPVNYDGIARLRPGVTLAEANADVERMLPIVLRSFPPPPGYSLKIFEDARMGPDLRTLKQHVVGDVGTLLWVLMGGIGFVLLIACANVANLLLVRAQGRQQELAIRAALGATPGRIAAVLLFENLVLALLGGVLGLAIAYAALRVLIAMAPSGLPRLQEIGIDGPTLVFSLAASLVASLLFGSVPVLKYAGKHVGTGAAPGWTFRERRPRAASLAKCVGSGPSGAGCHPADQFGADDSDFSCLDHS